MRGSYVAELLKLRKRAASWVLLAAAAVLSLTFGYLLPYVAYATGEDTGPTEGMPPEVLLRSVLPDSVVANTIGGFPVFAGALALVLGALLTGGEYGWGTLKTILTQGPGRLAVAGAQLAALATALLGWVLVIGAGCAASSAAIALAENRPLDWPPAGQVVEGLGAGWLVLLAWGLGGALLGTVLRGVALPIGLGVVWVLAVESLVRGVAAGLLPGFQAVADAMPGVNAGSLVWAVTSYAAGEPPPGVGDDVSGARALITVTCYALAFGTLAIATLRRRDVL